MTKIAADTLLRSREAIAVQRIKTEQQELYCLWVVIQRQRGPKSLSSASSLLPRTLHTSSPILTLLPFIFCNPLYQIENLSSSSPQKKEQSSAMAAQIRPEFEDYLPQMADKLGGEGLITELCNGFRLLMDRDEGLITFQSLKKNSALLGLQELRDDELESMIREGDLDGDGALNQMEFCVLMFRLSPELMEDSQLWLQWALIQELKQGGF
ncbi:hypothetical protein Nepgr_014439 [Nepenthes gracilis]|uniref:EF-hand domain-containing protein n=1 Tax=Nepenthes gracilis TaxID=150966 RepID=A0AAD3XPV1_NEPGR|nr:hypothetical protein Nepgr_014439 [Nepenthes gracilis]